MCCFPCCKSEEKPKPIDSKPKLTTPVPITSQPESKKYLAPRVPSDQQSTPSPASLTLTPPKSTPSSTLTKTKPVTPRNDKFLKIIESINSASELFTDDDLLTLNEQKVITSLIMTPPDDPSNFLSTLEKTVKDYQSNQPSPNDPILLEAQLKLAEALNDHSGRYKTSLELSRQVVQSHEKTYGQGHVNTLRAKLVHANSLLNLTLHDNALDMFEQVYEKTKGSKDKSDQIKELGVRALLGMARCSKMAGDCDEALELLGKASKILNGLFGDEKNAETIKVELLKVKLYKKLKKFDEANTLAKFSYKDLRNCQNPQVEEEDLLMMKFEHLFGSLMKHQGDRDIVYGILWEIFRKESKVLGCRHPLTLSTVLNFGTFFERIGKMELAANIYRGVYKKLSLILGPNHPKSIKANGKLNDLLIATGAIYVWRC